MIWGRPLNIWLGVLTALTGAVELTLVLALGFDAKVVAALTGAYGLVGGAIITAIAYQPPTIAAKTDVHVVTPNGAPNATATLDVTPAGEVVITHELPA